jgi:hypothetical protein
MSLGYLKVLPLNGLLVNDEPCLIGVLKVPLNND